MLHRGATYSSATDSAVRCPCHCRRCLRGCLVLELMQRLFTLATVLVAVIVPAALLFHLWRLQAPLDSAVLRILVWFVVMAVVSPWLGSPLLASGWCRVCR